MPRAALVLGLAVFAALPAAAQPPAIPLAVTGSARIDGALKVPPHKLVRLAVAADKAEAVHWRVTPPGVADFATPTAESPSLIFTAPPGKYVVEAFVLGVKEGRPTLRIDTAEVVVGDPAPVPPPVPPSPPPVPPAPNPYRAQLRAAFDGDAGADRDAIRLKLVELYRLGAEMAGAADVTTTDVLRERLRRAAATLAADQLVGLRTAIAQLVAPVLPLGQPLDADRRRQAAELFRLVAEALAW